MPQRDGYIEYIKDCLRGVSGLTLRKMFGGWGIYQDGLIFAIVADDQLYFKRGDANAADFDEYKSRPFTYTGHNGKPYQMSYWEVPEEVMENG